MSLVAELRRRNVFRVAAAYLVVGWLLTEVLTTILPTLGAPDWASRAVILIFAFGFIPAVVISWFYELTPEGIKRDHEVTRDEGHRRTRKRLDHLTVGIAIVLIILVGLFSARQTSDDPVPDPVSNASVAVLPFVNMSNDQDNEYFSDGLTETLLHMLAQIPDLKVAARTSSFAFKDQSVGIQEIARALEVAHVLEGSVQRVGDRVRITAQLIRASDGFHVFSENFDRELDDIFLVQDEIAEKVGRALSESLLGSETPTKLAASLTTTNTDAYDLYLQACKARSTYSFGGLIAAENLLKGALLIDPDFAEAKTELASSYIHQLETGLLDEEEAYEQIIAITEQVLAENPGDLVARAASIYATTGSRRNEGDVMAAEELIDDLETIVAVAPEELQPRILLVRAYESLKQHDKSLPVLEAALKRDPFNPIIHYELGTAYMRLQRWDDARAALERALEIEPAQPNAYTNLGIMSLHDGDGIGFVTQFLKAINIDPKDHELPGILAGFLYQLGLVEIGDDFRDRVLTLAPTSAMAYQVEMLRAIAIGDDIGSVASAQSAIEDDIEERRDSYSGAVRHLLRMAVREGNGEEMLAWIEQQAPGIFDLESQRVPYKYRNAQGNAFDAWYVTLPRDEMLRRLDALIEFATQFGFGVTDDPRTYMSILALRGDTNQAIDVALQRVFTRPVATNLDWRETLAQAQFEAVVADPRVQEAMQRWDEQEAALRGDVQSYFQDMQAAN